MHATPPSSTASSRTADRGLRIAGALVGVALFAILVAFLWRALGAGDLALKDARLVPLAVSAGFLVAANMTQAYAWHVLMKAAGGTESACIDGGRWALSLLGKYVPGKVFNAVGRLVLYRGSAPGPAGLTAALAAEMLLTLSAAALVAAAALLSAGDAVPLSARWAAVIGAAVGLAVGFSTWFDRAAGWLAARLLRATAPAVISRSHRIAPFGLQLLSYVLLGAGLYVLTLAWPTAAAAPPAAVIGALCLSGIVGILVFIVPAGIGVREGALVWILAPVTGPALAAFVAIAARVWLTAGDAAAVAIGAWLLRNVGRGNAT